MGSSKAYWNPLYAFLRRRGYKREDAQNLAQGFSKRFGRHVRNEIAQTVATPEEVSEEMRYLQALLG